MEKLESVKSSRNRLSIFFTRPENVDVVRVFCGNSGSRDDFQFDYKKKRRDALHLENGARRYPAE